MKKSLLVLGLACCALIQGCNGGGTPPPPPGAARFSVNASAVNATAGTAMNFTVSAVDNSGNVVTSYAGTVHFTSSDPQAALPADSPLNGGAGNFTVTFKTAGSQTITATDSSISGSSGGISVSPAAAAKLSITPPATAPVAGTAFNITVNAQDAYGNVANSYSGTVQFTSSDPQASLPAGPNKLTNGTGSFSITLKTAGNQTITASDTANVLSSSVSNSISVTPAAVKQLSVVSPPAATVGIAAAITVKALDAYANVATSYAGTVQLTSSDAQAVIQPPSQALSSGSGTFSVTFKTISNQTVLTATDTANASLTAKSSAVNVVSNAATHLSVGAPTNATTRATFNFTVTALDAANNPSAGYTGTVHLTSTDSQALLPANSALTGGTASLSATMETAGNQTLTATDIATVSISGSSAINVTAAKALTITSNAPPSGTYGATYGGIVSVRYAEECQRRGANVVCSPCNFNGCYGPPCNVGMTNTPCHTTGVRQVFHGFEFLAAGGVGAYRWTATALPPGLTIDPPTGEILGTPTLPGTYPITVTVTDLGLPPVQTTGQFSILINNPPPPTVNTALSTIPGVENAPFAYTFTANGAQPFTWIESGPLPNGLTFNISTGVLSGTPTVLGSFSITITATDEFKQDSAPANFTIVINQHGFIPTGSMATARRFHTATLLQNGKVLIAGGEDGGSNAFASAELFDPSTGTFSPTGSMTAARAGHTATLLNNGKVLITGGTSGGTAEPALSSAELYDPGTGTFAATTGSMIAARASHVATLLNDGTVLLTGGDVIFFNGIQNTNIASLSSAETFDPSTGMFTATSNMTTARESHTATLLSDGTVLVAGGSDGAVGNTTPAATVLNSAEIFNAGTRKFTATGNMTVARDFLTATLLNTGKVLIAGGTTPSTIATAGELFDPSKGSFAATGNMADPRFYHDATLLKDGTVLLSGGTDANNTRATATAEIYDPTAATFAATQSMTTPRIWHTSTLLQDGRVLVTGGADSSGALTDTAELYE